MDTVRYMYVRGELERLYNIIMNHPFEVVLPLNYFLTKAQLDHLEENPPITGFESLVTPVKRPYSINRLLDAFDIMGSDINIGFRYPRNDIPLIYETIQDWIRYWIEIKRGAGYLRTPPIEELELIEMLGRYVFGAYSHYHYEKIAKNLQVNTTAELTLLDIFKGQMMYGPDAMRQELSYISYLDEYKSEIGHVSTPSTNTVMSLSNFMGGFGGGL